MRDRITILFLVGSLAAGGCSLLTDLDGLSSGDPGGTGAGGTTTSTTTTTSTSSAGGSGGEGGASTSTSTSGGGGAGGAGGGAVEPGCADGTREAYLDGVQQPDIAACAGAFSVAGVIAPASFTPMCGRQAGNDGMLPTGQGCSVEDLCAAGWHVCISAGEVQAMSTTGACPTDDGNDPPHFWLTRQAQNANQLCAAGEMNNLVGCGVGLGSLPQQNAMCMPLDRVMNASACNMSMVWDCPGFTNEAATVVKAGPDGGGVLCCRGNIPGG